MKKNSFIKALSLALAIVFSLNLSVGVNAAIDEHDIHNRVTKIVTVDVADNDQITFPDGYDHGYIPTVSTVQNSDGTYCVAVYKNSKNDDGVNDGYVQVFEITADYVVTKSLRLASQLDEFAAFTKGSDGYYYVLFANILTFSQKGATALRLVKYSPDGVQVDALDISSSVEGSFMGIKKLSAANNVLYADGNYITGSIGRMMFSSSEAGETHQSSYAFAVDVNTFTQVSKENSVIIPYASHSFHQMIVKDGNDYLYVERGDAFPRAFQIVRMSGNGWVKNESVGTSFTFKGENGDNHTYSQLGGMVASGSNFLLVGTYQNKTESTTQSSANLFVQSFASATLKAGAVKYLTKYDDITGVDPNVTTVNNPKVVRVSSNKIAIPYMISNMVMGTEEMHVMFVDNSGNKLSDKTVHTLDNTAVLPHYGNVFFNSSKSTIEWFSIKNGILSLNSLEECENLAKCPLSFSITAITPANDTITVAQTASQKLEYSLTPSNAVNTLTWRSLDESVATVSRMGVVTGVGIGSTSVVATAASGITAQFTVNVVARVPVTGLSIVFSIGGINSFEAKNVSIGKGVWLHYGVTALPSTATNGAFEITVSNPSVLRFEKSNEGFQGLSAGNCVVTFYSVSDPSVSQSYTVTVTSTEPTTVKPTTVKPPTSPVTQPTTSPATTAPVVQQKQSFFARLISFLLSLFSFGR